MARLRDMIRALFRPTPPPTDEERKRMAEARPATDDEIAAAKDSHCWKTTPPGAG